MRHPFLRSAGSELKDPNFKNVTLLLHGDGTNGGQNNTFVDGSTNNFTITRNGNTTQGTFSPYGSNWSNYFDGTGDYLTVTYTTANFDWWTTGSDFTVEAWVYANSWTNWSVFDSPRLVGNMDPTGGTNGWSFGPDTTGKLRFYYYTGVGRTVISSATLATSQWNHIAMTKTSSGITLFINGTAETTTAIVGTPQSYTAQPLTIGSWYSTSITGYVSNLRIVRGTAVYSGNFTVPTSPLTAVSNTKYLTCQSNRFRDTSSNNLTITRTGDVSVQRFSPFAPTAAYAAGTIGGSGYFDGTGDYLRLAPGAAFAFGTGDFTVELWVYPVAESTSTNGGIYLIDARNASQTTAWLLGTNLAGTAGNAFVLGWSDGSADLISTGTLSRTAWNHVVYSRSGTTGSLFLNGTRVGTKTDSKNYNISPTQSTIGSRYDGSLYQTNGYICDIRTVKGTAVYDPTQTTLTVPTAPLTAITNTSLLLNFQNAAIRDNAMMAVPETVGNAQIDTTTKKYGTGSLYFDGTGDYLSAPFDNGRVFGTGDFTIEYWINPISNASGCMVDLRSTELGAGGVAYSDYFATGGKLGIYISGNTYVSTSTVPTGQWTHIAVSRSGTALRVFFNGIQDGSTVANSQNLVGGPLKVGVNVALNGPFNGYLDDLRITKGVARYTANFTPPTAPFPNL